jgi:hypothetical protein
MKCQYCDLGQPIISHEKNGFIDGRTIKIGFHITNVYGMLPLQEIYVPHLKTRMHGTTGRIYAPAQETASGA